MLGACFIFNKKNDFVSGGLSTLADIISLLFEEFDVLQ